MRAAILCVGTELTSGQILNKNAAWLSTKLRHLGVRTSSHLVVPDDRDLILSALHYCSKNCDTLFVTGGLGPTTDDFTRELVAEWSMQPLVFDETSWHQITERLTSRGIQVREAQRQQCLFPQGARILVNPDGTANAFYLRVADKDVFVLPGPPKEIAAVWANELGQLLQSQTAGIDKMITYSWDTLGLGESDIAHLTETCLQNISIEKGYRVHLPYVEVKASFLESEKSALLPHIQRLEKTLSAYTVTRNGDTIPDLLAQQLTQVKKIEVVDSFPGAILFDRLSPAIRAQLNNKIWNFSSVANSEPAESQTLRMTLEPLDATRALCKLQYKDAHFKDIFEAPLFISKVSERKALYFAERAMIFWHKTLKNLI
ncbi:MAG: competence/damage-inducible protein A [Bdellovibrionaceae bacterium]|nr:competence/damage-inducible protein A [Pseudobdellovibrionaceae bacterium]